MKKLIRKAVIPAAGFGTRMLPASKAVPKELLPVIDRPAIQYVVEEAAAAGIDDVLMITAKEKRALEDHFRRNPQLEARLAKGGQEQLLADLNRLVTRVGIHYVHQPNPKGLGDAVLHAREHVNDEPFLCLLGDTLFSGDPLPAVQLLQAYERFGAAVVGLEEVPPEKVGRYGIVGGEIIEPGVMRIQQLVEKPALKDAPSRFAIAARYVLTPRIFDCLEKTRAGANGEVQLTDAMHLYLQREQVYGILLKSRRHDIGNAADWLLTNLHFAQQNPKLWPLLLRSFQSLNAPG